MERQAQPVYGLIRLRDFQKVCQQLFLKVLNNTFPRDLLRSRRRRKDRNGDNHTSYSRRRFFGFCFKGSKDEMASIVGQRR